MKQLLVCISIVLFSIVSVPQVEASLWNHILTYKANFRYPPKQKIDEEKRWWAEHYDVMLGSPDLKKIAPNNRFFTYDIDMTVFQSEKYPRYAELQSWARENKANIEECFLHFLEDTVIDTPKGDIVIKGSKEKKISNRVQTFIWSSKRWVVNPADAHYRAFYTQSLNKALLDGKYGYSFDGVFIDEHGAGFPSIKIKSGGGVLEYGGKKPADLVPAYNLDVVSFLSDLKSRTKDKTIIINTAESTHDNSLQRALAVDGALMELIITPVRQGSSIVKSWEFVEQLSRAGKMVVMNTGHNLGAPKKYVKGAFTTVQDRTEIFSLAYYYLVKDQENRDVFFQIGGGWNKPFNEQWITAQETDIGRPIAARKVIATGKDPNGSPYTVHWREFEKALVVMRPKDNWNYEKYDDSTGIELKLPKGNYLQLHGDGSQTAIAGSINIRNAEAYILIKKAAQ